MTTANNALENTTPTARTRVALPPSRKWLPKRWYIHILLWIAIIIIGFPLIYAVIVGTQTNGETSKFQFTPGSNFWHNLESVLDRNLLQFMLNSTVLAIFVTVGKTILSLMAGLAFVYFRFPGKWIVFGFVLLTLLMPTEMLIIALFRLISNTLQWGNTFWAISVPFLASATGAFLFRQHFSNIPAELSEASQLDGANPLQFLIQVLIPLSWNTIGALAVIQFVYMWNQYLWPLLVVKDERLQVVQVALGSLQNFEGSTTYGPLMLAAVIATLPPVVVFVLLQKQFMSGFAISRDK